MSQQSSFTDTFCKDVIMAENRILEVFILTFPVYPCKTALTNTVRLRSEDGLTLKTTVSFETLNVINSVNNTKLPSKRKDDYSYDTSECKRLLIHPYLMSKTTKLSCHWSCAHHSMKYHHCLHKSSIFKLVFTTVQQLN